MSAALKIDLDSLKPKAPEPPSVLPETFALVEREAAQYTPQGLGVTAFGRYPSEVQYYLKIALIYNHLPLDVNMGSTSGTVPEMVFFGMLLKAGFRPTKNGFLDRDNMSFIFQSEQLGGRQPGGAVADFVVYYTGLVIAVRVQSTFHSIESPFFVGGEKVEQDKVQQLVLSAAPGIDRLVDVNQPEDGSPLERGPFELMRRDLSRVLYG